jgi:hypothetical protein
VVKQVIRVPTVLNDGAHRPVQEAVRRVNANFTELYGRAVSVQDFGAVGDGVTDDTAAIQSALNSGAKRVYAPAATYKTSAGLSIPSGVELVGDGKGKTFINCTTASVTQAQRIVLSAAIYFNGTSAGDNYTTYYNASGDYFLTGPTAFAAASTIKAGAISFTAADSVSALSGDWFHISEGLSAWHPAKSEFVKVSSASGTAVTLNTKLRNSYSNSTSTSLGRFIRDYALTTSPGSAGAGYPDMSTWGDAGFRAVTPVVNAAVRGVTIQCNQSGSVSKIGWLSHIAIGCEIDVEIEGGTFWVVDCQDLRVKVRGGTTAASSSYVANGTNGVVCDIDTINQIAIEEGAQNVSGVVKGLGYCTIKQFSTNVNIGITVSADSTPALEVSTVRDVIIKPYLKSRGSALSIITPTLSTIATNISQEFLSGEASLYYGCGLTTMGGECISIDNPTLSINTSNSGQVRCIDTVVPATQTARYKGTQVVDGTRRIPRITAAPTYSDLESGDRFISDAYGEIRVTGRIDTTISSQFGFPGTLNQIIVDDITTGGAVQVGDIAVFRLSDSASAVTNWSWAAVQITKVQIPSKAIEYTPANPSARTAITAAGEDRCAIYRISARFAPPAVIVPRSGSDAQYGGTISGVGTTYGGPLQLGTYHLWVDTTGDLRIKDGVPTGDTDGTVVGTQS